MYTHRYARSAPHIERRPGRGTTSTPFGVCGSGAIPNFDVSHALLKNYAVAEFRTLDT